MRRERPEPAAATDPETASRFRAAMLPHLDAAYSLARYLARDPDRAADITQDAYLRALRAFATWRGEDARAWLLAIVRNRFYTEAAARGRDPTVPLGPEADDAAPLWDAAPETPEAALIRDADAATLRALLESIPTPYREALVLRELEEMSYRQISAVTGAPVGTVMSRLARARRMLESAWAHRSTQGEVER